jgi:Flp pilus assembly protein TadD
VKLNPTTRPDVAAVRGGRSESDAETEAQLAEAQKEQGNAAFKNGDVAQAVLCYSRSLELEPSNAAVFANLAAAYLKAGASQQAVRALPARLAP